jgi:transcriptional regulator with XRE-family HTH domain
MTTATPETAFAGTLTAFRRARGISQQQLADHLQISRSTLKSWERGDPRRRPHILTQEGVIARLNWDWIQLDPVAEESHGDPVANSPDSQ